MECLNTRDLQRRMDELEDLESCLQDARDEMQAALDQMDDEEIPEPQREDNLEDARGEVEDAEAAFGEDEEVELDELRELSAEVGGDWRYGETLIPVELFPEYVEELCRDCGYISNDLPHWIVVDWEATAENVPMDYSLVTYQGNEYYVRIS